MHLKLFDFDKTRLINIVQCIGVHRKFWCLLIVVLLRSLLLGFKGKNFNRYFLGEGVVERTSVRRGEAVEISLLSHISFLEMIYFYKYYKKYFLAEGVVERTSVRRGEAVEIANFSQFPPPFSMHASLIFSKIFVFFNEVLRKILSVWFEQDEISKRSKRKLIEIWNTSHFSRCPCYGSTFEMNSEGYQNSHFENEES